MNKCNTVFIYGLVSTGSPLNVRYIGKTIQDIKYRVYEHVRESKYKNLHKNRWIRKEMSRGYKISWIKIDEVSIEDWKFWEMYWIYKYKNDGYNLTNVTSGGDSCPEGVGSYVYIIDRDGKIVTKCKSIAAAARITGRNYKNISRALNKNTIGCNGKYRIVLESIYDSTKDYSVKRKKRVVKSTEQRLNSWKNNSMLGAEKTSKPIGAFDNGGNLIHSFPSISSIGKMNTEFKVSGVTKTLYGNRHTHKGLIWRYL